jgi:hypothetical protein
LIHAVAARRSGPDRRAFVLSALGSAAAVVPVSAVAARSCNKRFARTDYDRYIGLMNAGDLRFADYYADDIRFVMNIRGKADVLAFYARQQPYVRETLEVLFFCSDEHGAAAQVQSELRCIQDCPDTALFGRALKTGEVQLVRGCLLYSLDARGAIAAINGPPPEILQPWQAR